MRLLQNKKLGQAGVLHYVIPLAIIVLFGAAGIGYFVISDAATSQQVTMAFTTATGRPSDDCVTGGLTTGSRAYVETCTVSKASNWRLTAGTLNDPSTGMCLQPIGIPAKGKNPVIPLEAEKCIVGDQLQQWVRPNITYMWLNKPKVATSLVANIYTYNKQNGRRECIVDPESTIQPSTDLRTPIAMVGCSSTNNAADQEWTTLTYPTATKS
jgi:hypothetical protein